MDCVFCRIVAGSEEAVRVYEDAASLAFLPQRLVAKGHVLVIPKRHAVGVWDIADDDARQLIAATLRVAQAVKTALDPDGINVLQATEAAAGQSVPHFHFHIVPRGQDDLIGLMWPPEDVHAASVDREEIGQLLRSAIASAGG
jgi:diadenosine tetraphosphate (Ap4A) HIT family hydrolase